MLPAHPISSSRFILFLWQLPARMTSVYYILFGGGGVTQSTKPYSSQSQALQQLKERKFKDTATQGTVERTWKLQVGYLPVCKHYLHRGNRPKIKTYTHTFYCFTFSHSEDISD
jgi:hypothetical protein